MTARLYHDRALSTCDRFDGPGKGGHVASVADIAGISGIADIVDIADIASVAADGKHGFG